MRIVEPQQEKSKTRIVVCTVSQELKFAEETWALIRLTFPVWHCHYCVMSHTFIAYIDESGDDGLAGNYRIPGKGGGSSHWLGIGAVVWRVSRDLDAVKWAKDIIGQLPEQKQKKPLHFVNLTHAQRIMALSGISAKPMRIVAAVSHKPSMHDGVFTGKNQLYHYLSRYLIERISWLCRDMRPKAPEGNGQVKIVFSRRGGMSDSDFRSYLNHLRATDDPEIIIHWPVIDIEGIESFDQASRFGLQLADLAISGLCNALEPDFYGNCEPRFSRMLKQNVYERGGNFLSYGAKLVPNPGSIPQSPALTEFLNIFKGI